MTDASSPVAPPSTDASKPVDPPAAVAESPSAADAATKPPADGKPVAPDPTLAWPVTSAMKLAVASRDPHAPVSLAHTAESATMPLAPTPTSVPGEPPPPPNPLEVFFAELQQAKRVAQAQCAVVDEMLTRIGAMHGVFPAELDAMEASVNKAFTVIQDNAKVERDPATGLPVVPPPMSAEAAAAPSPDGNKATSDYSGGARFEKAAAKTEAKADEKPPAPPTPTPAPAATTQPSPVTTQPPVATTQPAPTQAPPAPPAPPADAAPPAPPHVEGTPV